MKDSLTNTCKWKSCVVGGGYTRDVLQDMSTFCAGCFLCGEVENGTKLSSKKDPPKQYKLNCCLEINSTDEGKNKVSSTTT